eukprot:6202649-Pleurochrysis_carterae.AAC.1
MLNPGPRQAFPPQQPRTTPYHGSDPDNIGPAPLRVVEETLDDALLAAGDKDAFARLDSSDFSSYLPPLNDRHKLE